MRLERGARERTGLRTDRRHAVSAAAARARGSADLANLETPINRVGVRPHGTWTIVIWSETEAMPRHTCMVVAFAG